MAFRFRLQAVLDHRAYLAEAALAEYARRLNAQRQCQQQADWLEAEARQAFKGLRQRERRGMPAADFILANEYLTVLRLQATRQRARLPVLASAAEAARQKLVEATRDRKVLEILRERHHAAWLEADRRLETKLIDEAAVGAFVRRQ